MDLKQITIGTRNSLLALAQVELCIKHLNRHFPDLSVNVKTIVTSGDKKQGTPAASSGDKKDWVIEIEQAILAGEIDLAVHSGKDMPSDYEVGTEIFSILERGDPHDVFIGQKTSSGQRLLWSQVPNGGIIGTASLRRQASVLALRPELRVIEHRGNVTTRIEKLTERTELSGIILAKAGIERLKIADLAMHEFDPLDMLPAVNQGTMCAQIRSDNLALKELLNALIDSNTQACFVAERSCIAILGADCKSSVSAYATINMNQLSLSARVLSRDGQSKVELLNLQDSAQNASILGKQVGQRLLALGAGKIIEDCRII